MTNKDLNRNCISQSEADLNRINMAYCTLHKAFSTLLEVSKHRAGLCPTVSISQRPNVDHKKLKLVNVEEGSCLAMKGVTFILAVARNE